MPRVSIYPGAERELARAGDVYSVFDEASLDYLAGFGLDEYLKS
jgi:hypothetical protein